MIMYSFKLDSDTVERMTAKFKVFMSYREKARALLGGYVADYRSYNGTALDRYEYLKEKYKPLAPNLTHLVYDEDGEIYWSATDISILLDRDSTSVNRTLRKIEETDNWRVKLYDMRKLVDANHVPPVYVYKEGIFDLMIDFYEEEYLQRFVKPRRGDAISEEEIAEIYRLWKYLKSKDLADRVVSTETNLITNTIELPDIPPMSLKEIIRWITGKLFTIKMGAFFIILMALGYELSTRWKALYIWLPVLSFFVFVFCVLNIRRQRFNHGHLANIGAGALLFCSLWFVGLLAQDENHMFLASGRQGAIFPFKKTEKPKLVLEPNFGNNALFFNIEAEDNQNVKEFFYRIKPDTEYRSTGFVSNANITGLLLPSMVIPNEKHGLIEIDVKYTDLKGREQGPYNFEFDTEQVEMDAVKYLVLNYIDEWIIVRPSYVKVDNVFVYNTQVRDTIEKVMYGINKETPDTPFILQDNEAKLNIGRNPGEILIDEEVRGVQYVSVQVFFKDKTSTDIRIYTAPWFIR